MDHVAEYVGGPADGRREPVQLGPEGLPPAWRPVTVRPWTSALEPGPPPPATVHRYDRRPTDHRSGPVWRYDHRRRLH
jgi:hypothetical protein